MRTAYVSCFHGRHRVSEVFLAHCADIGIIGDVFAAVTRGDTANLALLQRYGVHFVEADNEPLGAKHNAALRLALSSTIGFTHFMVLPSDDLVSSEWANKCSAYTYATVPSCAIVEPVTGRAKLLHGSVGGRMKFGACRVFAREVVEGLGGKLWEDRRVKALDSCSDGRVRAAGYSMQMADVKGPAFVDIKTPESLWDYDTWTGDGLTMDAALWMCGDKVTASVRCLSTHA